MPGVTFIVTIDPVKDLRHLNLLVHSLNLQTDRRFDVVFYNQTRTDCDEILARLKVQPAFEYQSFAVDPEAFFGDYPLWDLYAFHSFLLERDLVQDYFMSLHMEEFLDPDYLEQALSVLQENEFDILFGNLSYLPHTYDLLAPSLDARTAASFDAYLLSAGAKDSLHWAFDTGKWSRKNILSRANKYLNFSRRSRIQPSERGFWFARNYVAEDLFFMKKSFANETNWYLKGHNMYLEDIHICEQEGVCELGKHLKRITKFPAYFDKSKIYHVDHEKYYFNIVDEEFTSNILIMDTKDPILMSLKEAISMYRDGQIGVHQALLHSRQNAEGTGTQNMNYKYHMLYLQRGDAPRR